MTSDILRKFQILTLLIFVLAGNTQSQIIYDTLQLNELEIISKLDDLVSPTKTTTIDSIARTELNLVDIGELLSAFTPVFVKSYGRGSLSTVSFRGTGASHTKVLWEGININSPMLGQTDFSQLPGSFFDEVELLYGGGSLTKVSGAIGGSINLKNNTFHDSNQLFSFQQSVGSFGTYLTSASLNLNKSGFRSNTRIIRQSSLNNFTYYNNAILPSSIEMTQTNADFVNKGFTQQFSYSISDKQEITLTSWNQWNSRNIPVIMTNTEKGGYQREYQNDFFSRNILIWKLHNTRSSWEAKAAYFHEELAYYLRTSDSLQNTISLIDSKNRVENYSFMWSVLTELGNNIIFKAGMELLHQEVTSNNYVDTKQRSQVSSYVSLKKNFKNVITTEALVRAELTDAKILPIMPMLGFNYKPFTDHDFHLRLNISRNYNLPSLNDLYWYPGGNEDLKPEQSLEAEIGLLYATTINGKHLISFSGSAYASSVTNWIIWQPGDYYRDWSSINIPNVYARGIELSFKIKGKIGSVRYNLFSEYTYTRSTNNSDSAKMTGLSDIQLIYVPIHSANGYFNVSTKGYYASWSLSYTGSRNTSLNIKDKYSYTLPGYMLNNISVGKKFMLKKSQLNIRMKIYNIFDIDYQAVLWRAMPGRNFEVSLSFGI